MCDTYIPTRKTTQHSKVWWDPQLTIQRNKVTALRRLSQKQTEPTLRSQYFIKFKKERALFRRAIKKCRSHSWKKFCEQISTSDPYKLAYKILKTRPSNQTSGTLNSIQKPDGSWTQTIQDTAQHQIQQIFPNDDASSDNQDHFHLRSSMHIPSSSTLDLPITEHEIRTTISSININKAPGPDRLPPLLLPFIFKHLTTPIFNIFTFCFTNGYFPQQWKIANLILISKSLGCGSRPISLLSCLGKILDKIVASRLTRHLMQGQHIEHQYSFLPQKSSEQAVEAFCHKIKSAINNKKHYKTIALSFDIKGAFDTTWWPYIVHNLKTSSCPSNILAFIRSFLSDRQVSFQGFLFS